MRPNCSRTAAQLRRPLLQVQSTKAWHALVCLVQTIDDRWPRVPPGGRAARQKAGRQKMFDGAPLMVALMRHGGDDARLRIGPPDPRDPASSRRRDRPPSAATRRLASTTFHRRYPLRWRRPRHETFARSCDKANVRAWHACAGPPQERRSRPYGRKARQFDFPCKRQKHRSTDRRADCR